MDFEVAENNFQKSCVTRCFSKGYKKLTVKKGMEFTNDCEFLFTFSLAVRKTLETSA